VSSRSPTPCELRILRSILTVVVTLLLVALLRIMRSKGLKEHSPDMMVKFLGSAESRR